MSNNSNNNNARVVDYHFFESPGGVQWPQGRLQLPELSEGLPVHQQPGHWGMRLVIGERYDAVVVMAVGAVDRQQKRWFNSGGHDTRC